MARKDIFANITATGNTRPERRATSGYANRGASRSMINSLSELAQMPAMCGRAPAGEAGVVLDPGELLIGDGRFARLRSKGRPDLLASEIRKARGSCKRATAAGTWQSKDGGVSAEFKDTGNSYSIALKSRDAASFGRFISGKLERLHEEFKQIVKPQGD